jgi:hypothetical protein
MTKEVAKTKKNEVVKYSDDLPSYIDPNSQRGNEDVGKDDVVLPRIMICQALSPQRKKTSEDYIPGIEEGDLFNSVTGQIYKGGVDFVSVIFIKEFLVWVSRDADPKGGFRGSFRTEVDAIEFIKEQEDAKDLEVVNTASNYGLIINDDGSVEQAVISMSKSQLKISRKLNSMVKLAGGDRFSRAYHIGTVEENGTKGDFINYSVAPLGYVSEEVYQSAQKAYQELKPAVTGNS